MAQSTSVNSRQNRESYWRSHMAEWSGSGLSQAEYCRRSGLALSTFQLWKRRLKPQEPSVEERSIIAVPFPPPSVPAGPAPKPLLLHVGSDFLVEIGGDFCPFVLEKLITTLERLS